MCRTFLIILLAFRVASAVDFNICPTREITASDGMIISPNYPQKYPPNTDCSLTIKQPLNRRIYFTFPDMNLTNGRLNNDCHDYVRIYLGLERSRKLCAFGTKHTSDFNIATVKFKSNGSIERSGFKIKFTSIKEKIYDSSQRKYITDLPAPISVCPSRPIQADMVGRISSPGFPVPNQGVQLNCTLTVKKPAAMKLVLRREIVMLKPGGNRHKPCPETLSCWAWGHYSRTCGTASSRRDKLYKFENGDLKIDFQSDGINPGRGFLMTYFLADRLDRYACVITGSNRSPSSYLQKEINMTDVFDFERSKDDITMRFDTSSSTGLVLKVEGGPNEYIILTVDNGKIVFKIKYGTANLTVTEDAHRIDDGKWHHVLVQRRGLNFSIQIDRNSPVTGHFPGDINQLAQYSRRNAAMYVFGAPSVQRGFSAYVKFMKINDIIQPVASYFFDDRSFTFMGKSWKKWRKEDYC